jgi:hypothetical protein
VTEDSPPRELPAVNFASFVVSLASSAMVHLGEVPDPVSGQSATDLTMARHTIDLLGLLEEKTKGNLDEDEARLLRTLTYELRVKYVEKTT